MYVYDMYVCVYLYIIIESSWQHKMFIKIYCKAGKVT